MTIKDFYTYCKQAKKTEPDPIKREVVRDTYQFMWECGATVKGVLGLIESRAARAEWDEKISPAHVEHYAWLGKLLAGEVQP